MATPTALGRVGEALRDVGLVLDSLSRQWALVGGLAVGARAEPRFTRDVDLAVSVTGDADAEQLLFVLQSRGYRPVALVEHELRKRLATARLMCRGEDELGIVVDLLLASSGIEAEVVASATETEVLPGMRIRVAQLGHLLALKLLSRDDVRRPQDLADINALLLEADSTDLERARSAIDLIHDRGFSRGRDLPNQLRQLLSERGR